jgi:hypothetical protein
MTCADENFDKRLFESAARKELKERTTEDIKRNETDCDQYGISFGTRRDYSVRGTEQERPGEEASRKNYCRGYYDKYRREETRR